MFFFKKIETWKMFSISQMIYTHICNTSSESNNAMFCGTVHRGKFPSWQAYKKAWNRFYQCFPQTPAMFHNIHWNKCFVNERIICKLQYYCYQTGKNWLLDEAIDEMWWPHDKCTWRWVVWSGFEPWTIAWIYLFIW